MSGHSKWSTIKRKKGVNDAAKGKIFSKVTKEIIISVREGGGDPNTNSRLRTAIIKGRSGNMPNINIDRAIKKGLGNNDGVYYDEVSYEGYAIGGVAILVECLTDNKNRTGPEVRHVFSKYGGNLGENGCVSYMFSRKGIILLDNSAIKEEAMVDLAIESGAEDVQSSDDGIEVISSPELFNDIIGIFEEKNYGIIHAEILLVPDTYISLDEESTSRTLRLIEQMEDLDDVQVVSHNLNIPE